MIEIDEPKGMLNLPRDKPLISLEIFYVYGFSFLTAIILIILRFIGFVEISTLLVGAASLSLIAVGRSTRCFYPLTRWTVMKRDGVNLDDDHQAARPR